MTFNSVEHANQWLAERYQKLSALNDKRVHRVLEVFIALPDLASFSIKIPAGRKINTEWVTVASRRMPGSHGEQLMERKGDVLRWGKQYTSQPI